MTIDGDELYGTVTEVSHTPKGGQTVVALTLDEPMPDGRDTVVLGLDELGVEDERLQSVFRGEQPGTESGGSTAHDGCGR